VPQWQVDWAGETVLINEFGDIVHAVVPQAEPHDDLRRQDPARGGARCIASSPACASL
jgi:hypothetical protein